VRSSYPLLARDQWLSLLREAGFDNTASVPAEDHGDVLLFSKLTGSAAATSKQHDDEGGWVLLGSRDPLVDVLGERLRSRGRRCVPIDMETVFSGGTSTAAVTRALAKARNCAGGELEGVVYIASAAGSSTVEDVRINAAGLLHLVQSLVSEGAGRSPRLVILTDRARDSGTREGGVNVVHAPLWGLGQVVTEEHPELRCLRVDLDQRQSDQDLDRLVDVLMCAPDEDQLAIRDGELSAPRLVRSVGRPQAAPLDHVSGEAECLELAIGVRGDLASIASRPCERRGAAAGQVEIEIMASGLGFRDVLNAIGMRSDDVPLGSEFAGRVVAVGAGVERFTPGDDVMGVGIGCFRSYVTAPEAWVVPMPAGMEYADAAALPSAYLTAVYALERVGGLRRGQKVLIHTAAGGVGLAAVRLAQRAGAEIYATAGGPEKRAYLRSLGLQNVYDSRTLEFADRIRESVPEGIDLVLNTLSGDFIDRSLSLLAPRGRFLEIGKSDIRPAGEVERCYPGVHYFAIDLVQVCDSDPAVVREMLLDIAGAIASSNLPALPCRTFQLAEASEAFRFMARAKHTGKVVLTWPRASAAATTGAAPRIRPDATYLVTGAFGGLGLLTARWLVERGARHLMLLGRRKPRPETAALLRELEDLGAEVAAVCADVADFAAVKALLDGIDSDRPLRGVFHAAGLLDDGVLAQQSLEKFDRVFAPKVTGSWNLHELTKDAPLDFFVLYSSTASLLGSPGQGNHAAANAFLDALAAERRRLGLPGLSINWGPWSVVGAAASLGERGERRFEEHGLGRISPEEGILILERLVLSEHPAQVGVIPVVWSRYFAKSAVSVGRVPRFLSRLAEKDAGAPTAPAGARQSAERLSVLLERALPAERVGLLERHVSLRAATVLGLDPAQTVDRRRPLSDIGLDSLMAVELRNLLTADLGRPQALPATLIFKYPTIEALARYLLAEMTLVVSPAADATDGMPEDAEEVEALSDEQARDLLADELSSLAELDMDEA
jgi:NADPH:quinone reductase-like Zn-dependent oxidoreductase